VHLISRASLSTLSLASIALASSVACSMRDDADPCLPIVNGVVAYMPAIDLIVRDARGQAIALSDTAVVYVGRDSVTTVSDDTLHLRAGPAAPGSYTVRVKRRYYADGIVRDVSVAPGRCGGPLTTTVPITLQLAPGAPPLRSVGVFGADFLYAPGVQRPLLARVDADAGIATTVSWRLSDTTIARIDASGLVTAKCTARTSRSTR
jgi:hypothetical protein